jgi:HlyD family secretion protein
VRGDLTVTVAATGTLQPTTQVDVSSELAGTLQSVEVDYNDTVSVGQVMARLDTSKLAASVANAEAQEASARARLMQAEATATEVAETLATQKELSERGIATRREMVSVEANDARARAALDMARADLTLVKANLALARADLDKAVIRSPIQGMVLNRKAEAGQIVGPGLNDPVLFVLAEDLARMELLANVDEADIGQVEVGQAAVFTVDAFDGLSFDATITQVRYASEVTDDVVTYKAVLAVENPDLRLRPGMTATATITVAEEQGALLVPNAALRWAPPRASGGQAGAAGLAGLILPSAASRMGSAAVGTGRSIWVLRDGAPVEVAVEIGANDGRMSVVTGEGLAEGDAVITDQIIEAD